MKKFTVISVSIIIVLLCAFCLFACNDDEPSDERTISFVTICDGKQEEAITAKIKVGETVNLTTYINFLPKPDEISIGHANYTGLFWDEKCFHKHDDDIAIAYDTTFYVLKTSEGVPRICFVLDGENYMLAILDDTQPVAAADFITTAYGKNAHPSQFEFYKDEAMTDKFDLIGLAYQDCTRNFWNCYIVYVKKGG